MKCLLEIPGDGWSVGKGQAVVEEDIFVTDGDDVVVEHAGIDEVWILKREARYLQVEVVQVCDCVGGLEGLTCWKGFRFTTGR